ncbi:MAG TPA: RidA family protein [Alphaproteobacteria bacterium]|nr:RidA family protein [Alphaproteobacteria bacterium]
MGIEHHNPETLFRLPGFSQIVVAPAGRLAFIAGQGPFDAEFNLVGGDDLRSQTVQAFRNLAAALAAIGATPADVVSSTMYVVGLDEKTTQIFVAAMSEALDGKPFPPNASSLIGVARLGHPAMKVEISAVASIP